MQYISSPEYCQSKPCWTSEYLPMFFRNTVGANISIPPAYYIRELVARQLVMKESDLSSWVVHVRKLHQKYTNCTQPSSYSCTHQARKNGSRLKRQSIKCGQQIFKKWPMRKSHYSSLNLSHIAPTRYILSGRTLMMP